MGIGDNYRPLDYSHERIGTNFEIMINGDRLFHIAYVMKKTNQQLEELSIRVDIRI